jgi:hypothetical protein
LGHPKFLRFQSADLNAVKDRHAIHDYLGNSFLVTASGTFCSSLSKMYSACRRLGRRLDI